MSRPIGGREEVEVEQGREVVVGSPRRLVAFPIAPEVRLRAEAAIGQFLRIRLQRDQFDAVAAGWAIHRPSGLMWPGQGAGGIGSPFNS